MKIHYLIKRTNWGILPDSTLFSSGTADFTDVYTALPERETTSPVYLLGSMSHSSKRGICTSASIRNEFSKSCAYAYLCSCAFQSNGDAERTGFPAVLFFISVRILRNQLSKLIFTAACIIHGWNCIKWTILGICTISKKKFWRKRGAAGFPLFSVFSSSSPVQVIF